MLLSNKFKKRFTVKLWGERKTKIDGCNEIGGEVKSKLLTLLKLIFAMN